MSGDEAEFIHLPNTLKQKVGNLPPGIDEEALKRAEAAIADMADTYLDWAEKDIDRLQASFDALKSPDANKVEGIKGVFNIAHDIKGQGGSFGFPLVTAVANQLCRFLEKVDPEKFGAPHLEVAQVHISALRMILQQQLRGDGGKVGDNLLDGLVAAIEKHL